MELFLPLGLYSNSGKRSHKAAGNLELLFPPAASPSSEIHPPGSHLGRPRTPTYREVTITAVPAAATRLLPLAVMAGLPSGSLPTQCPIPGPRSNLNYSLAVAPTPSEEAGPDHAPPPDSTCKVGKREHLCARQSPAIAPVPPTEIIRLGLCLPSPLGALAGRGHVSII